MSRPVEPRRISASVISCRVRCRSSWGKFAVKVGGGHATVHEEVAAGDERPVGAHEQRADGPYLIWGAATPDRRQLDHAPVSLAAGSGQLVLGERGEDNAGAGTSRCLAPALVGQADDRHLGDGRMAVEDLFDLGGEEILAER